MLQQCAQLKSDEEWVRNFMAKQASIEQNAIDLISPDCSQESQDVPMEAPSGFTTPTKEVKEETRTVTHSDLAMQKNPIELDRQTRDVLRTQSFANASHAILFDKGIDSQESMVMRNAMQVQMGEPTRADKLRFDKKRKEDMEKFREERKALRSAYYTPNGAISTPGQRSQLSADNFRMMNNGLDQNVVSNVNARGVISSVLNGDVNKFNQQTATQPTTGSSYLQVARREEDDEYTKRLKHEIHRRMRPDVNTERETISKLIKLYSVLNGSTIRNEENYTMHENIASFKVECKEYRYNPELAIDMMLQLV